MMNNLIKSSKNAVDKLLVEESFTRIFKDLELMRTKDREVMLSGLMDLENLDSFISLIKDLIKCSENMDIFKTLDILIKLRYRIDLTIGEKDNE